MGLDAVAPKGENQLIPDFIQEQFKQMYKYIVVVFDDDPAGRKGAGKYAFPAIWLPTATDLKDTADYIKKYGPESTKQLLKKLVTS
jgi:DNA primase